MRVLARGTALVLLLACGYCAIGAMGAPSGYVGMRWKPLAVQGRQARRPCCPAVPEACSEQHICLSMLLI